jgi:hypothetical protein
LDKIGEILCEIRANLCQFYPMPEKIGEILSLFCLTPENLGAILCENSPASEKLGAKLCEMGANLNPF